ncbi:MAG TPA: PadR family transcriptional regulator [Woeseiaceae bacterium]
MSRDAIPLLGYALLGLLKQRPSSGYDLRKMFATTPLGSFSDSPGAIYPALRRLEQEGFVRSRVEKSAGLRRKRTFELTPRGLTALKDWLRRPVARDEVVRGIDELMLRFAFMDAVLDAAASIRFLQMLVKDLDAYIPTLHEYLHTHTSNMPLSGRLALESGIESYETLRRWAGQALATYRKHGKGEAL